ncbi:MAG: Eco57I restriction-modification methylase domain-containing protein [bacterium]
MNPTQARNLIRETFEKPFDRGRFARFITELLNHVEPTPQTVYTGNYIREAFRPYISKMERIGKYKVPGGRKLDVLAVHLKREASLVHARTTQRNFIRWYLGGSRGGDEKDAALVAFVAPGEEDWRFSLVKMAYDLAPRPGGGVKAKRVLTPARRYSFLVGPNEGSHTAQVQLVGILQDADEDPTLERLEQAFGVETVTKEFFTEYRGLFLRVKDALDAAVLKNPKVKQDFADKNINTVDFAKKLLGQLVFLYFLQKKGWFGVGRDAEWGTGPKDFLRRLFCRGGYRNFFNDVLEPLFYEALARKRDADFYSRFDCKIPFLNGGLFDAIGGYDWVHSDILLPDVLFSNTERTEHDDRGTGILDVFDRYNFTVNEDEPLDKEVAVDPELLGKLYEKFNAITAENYDEYRDALKARRLDLERRFNHKYGVHYTPRAIVQAMCREALLEYLDSRLAGRVSHEELNRLITDADKLAEHEAVAQERTELVVQGKRKGPGRYTPVLSSAIREHADELDRALEEIRVCDPAVGSGAFVVGMMKEIVAVRMALDSLRPAAQRRKRYNLKRQAIERSLYGVDIDPGAVEIARLRLWLSMVVDEEDRRDILPLPNLDFRIAAGDALLGLPYRTQRLGHIERLKAQLFSETDAERRQKLKAQIDEELANCYKASSEHVGYEIRFDLRVVFSEVFPDSPDAGFDILIANPPYIRQEGVLREFGKAYKKNLTQLYPEAMVGTADIYVAFYARAHQLLKPDGIGCFISSTKWLRAAYGEQLCQCLLDRQSFRLVADFGELPVFETAATFPGIFLWQKRPRGDSPATWAVVKDLDECYREGVREHIARIAINVPASQFGKDKPRLARPDVADMRRKMEQSGPKLGELVKGKMYRGVVTGANDVFYVDEATARRLVAEDNRSGEIVKPVLMGDDVRRHESHLRGTYILFARQGENLVKYPAVLAYLRRFRKQLEPRPRSWDVSQQGQWPGRKAGTYKWCELQDATAYYDVFRQRKIIFPQTAMEPRFAMDVAPLTVDQTVYTVAVEDWFLLGILNSKPAFDWLKLVCAVLGDEDKRGRVRILTQYLECLPIPEASSVARQLVTKLAQQAQRLHGRRRKRVEKFLHDIGSSPAESSSKNMLEQPWNTEKCTDDYFRRKARGYPLELLHDVRDETITLTEEILRVEAEIDERVKGLYGL